MTQAVAYGDDATMATNYPLVRLISEDARVHYCRTFDHSTMAVATGHRRVRTRLRSRPGWPTAATTCASWPTASPPARSRSGCPDRLPRSVAHPVLVGELVELPLQVAVEDEIGGGQARRS